MGTFCRSCRERAEGLTEGWVNGLLTCALSEGTLNMRHVQQVGIL